ncbi:hypothetical protein Tco_0443695, partial [Tanacetum coccineum]
ILSILQLHTHQYPFQLRTIQTYVYIIAAYEVLPSPDYIPGPEVPPSPDYIPSLEEQPLPATATSPTADSPGYVPDSDPEEEPEE